MLGQFVDSILKLSRDTSVDVRMIAAISAGRLVLSEAGTMPKLMPMFLALLGPDQHVEVQKQTMALLRHVSDARPDALVPHFVSLIPTLISVTKDATGATKLAAERTLAHVLRLSDAGDERVATEYLARKDIGAVAKATITEPYIRRLVRISEGDINDLADYDV